MTRPLNRGRRRFLLVLVAGVCATGLAPAWAAWSGGTVELEEVVVTATRTPVKPGQLGSAVTVLGRREIEASGARDLADLLETVPSLDVSRAGGPGGTATLRIRGMSDAQTLLLIDGVQQNDPISPGHGADLATLSLDEVERVEIVRGPQSALYGADAIGGVVQVITRPASRRAGLSLAAGSHGQLLGRAELGETLGTLSLGLSLGRELQDGFSAAADTAASDPDGLSSTRGRLRADWRPRQGLDLSLALAGEHSVADLDNYGGPGGDDPNHQGETWRRSVSLGGIWQESAGRTQWRVWRQDTRREYLNPTDPEHPGGDQQSSFDGRVLHVELQHGRQVGAGHELLAALEWEGERGESYTSIGGELPWSERFPARGSRGTAAVLQDQWTSGPLLVTGSLRSDWRGDGADRVTGRLAAGWSLMPGTLLRGSYGTGFKPPSLYQLHSVYGDPSLLPESSRGWDLGLDWRGRSLRASLGWFRNDVRRQIEFGGDWLYHNIGRATSLGAELEIAGEAGAWLDWSAALQRQRSVDGRTGEALIRRPGTLARLALDSHLGPARLGLAWRYEGPREDLDFRVWPAAQMSMGGFALVNLRASWQWRPWLSSWLSLDNLLDRDYQELRGYRTPGRAWRLGLEWGLR